jgi:hypothetical protein
MLMRSVVLVLLIVYGVAWVQTPAGARDIFVSNTAGDDRFTGASPQNTGGGNGPLRTIVKALRVAGAGDRVVLENSGQPYRESVTLEGGHNSGSSLGRFTLAGNGATLDGSAPVPPRAWENYFGAVFRFRPPRSENQQLFLDDRPAPRVIVSHLAGAPPKLEPGQWCRLGGYLYFCVEQTKLPEDYRLSYSALDTGITLVAVTKAAISDLTIQGFRLDGIDAVNAAHDVVISRVVCRGNGRSGIAVGAASLAALESISAGDNGLAQVLALPMSEIHLEHCQLLSNTAPGLVDRGGKVYVDGKRIVGGIDSPRQGE